VSSDHISGGSGTDVITITGDDSVIDLSGVAGSTITIDPSWNTMGSITIPSSTILTGATGSTYSYTTSGTGYNWSSNPTVVTIGNDGIDMAAGTDIKMDGKSLKEFMNKMEERLAILVPDPKKLEKFEALKKAYEHYKLMEKLCQEEPPEGEE